VLLFFAGVTWDWVAGFTHAPGGQAYSNRSVFAWHYYEPPQLKDTYALDFGIHRSDSRRLQTGMFLTEFGAAGYNDKFLNESRVADAMGLSYIIWEYKDMCRETNETLNSPSQYAAWGACKTGYGGFGWDDATGQLDPVQATITARTYAYAIAGSLVDCDFEHTTNAYRLEFMVNPQATLPTEIFVDETRRYTKGLNVAISPPNKATFKHDVSGWMYHVFCQLDVSRIFCLVDVLFYFFILFLFVCLFVCLFFCLFVCLFVC
jgi:endoglycosylceramidase